MHWDGTAWQRRRESLSSRYNGVWGSSTDSFWTIEAGQLMNWNHLLQPQGPYMVDPPKVPLYSIWGTAPGDIWVVGSNGTVAHWNGTMVELKPANAQNLYGVWADMSTVWAVGAAGLIIISTDRGMTWNNERPNATAQTNLNGIWGPDAANLWAVGDQGTVLKRVGGSWVSQTSGTTNDLTGIFGLNAQNFWVVGQNGVVLQHRGP